MQRAVHDAVRAIEQESGRSAVTVPAIAARAGVTPSTVYRRWGDLAQLLSDVAVERLRPDGEPRDLGDLRADLSDWARHYAEEMASPTCRLWMRDALTGTASPPQAVRTCDFTVEQLDVIARRSVERGEAPPAVEDLLDGIVAPIVFRILFRESGLGRDYVDGLVDAALSLKANNSL